MILFTAWGLFLFAAWLAGAYDGLQYGWMPLLTGALFLLGSLLGRVGLRLVSRLLIIAGVLVASAFVGTQSGVGLPGRASGTGSALEWLANTAIFMALTAAVYFRFRRVPTGEG